MRQVISDIIEAFAKERGYSYTTDIVPTALAGGMHYPALLWVAPDATFDASRGRWTFKSTLYFVAAVYNNLSVSTQLSKLEDDAAALAMRLCNNDVVSAEPSVQCRPKFAIDNSGANAIEVQVTIYAYDC